MDAIYIDRSRSKPGRLFEDVSEDDSVENSGQMPGDQGSFFDFASFKCKLVAQLCH